MISDSIAISGIQGASDLESLQKNKITHVLNTVAHKHDNPYPDKFTYFSLNLNDDGSQCILLAI